MASIGTGYDLSVATYSPDGRIFQAEYAQKAVDSSGTAIGIRCKDGVVLGMEKLIVSKMLVENSNRCIFAVDRHAGLAPSGLVPDGRILLNYSMREAENYKMFYGEPIPGAVLCDRLASWMHLFTIGNNRPFGSCALLASYDADGPQLHVVEPTGTAHRYYATAVGKGRQAAKTELERLKLSDLSCADAIVEIAKIVHKGHDEAKDKPYELEMAWISDATNRTFQRVAPDMVAATLVAVKAALLAAEMAD